MSGLVFLDPGPGLLQDTLTPAQWAKFVQGTKELGELEELEAADYEPSVDALRIAPPVAKSPLLCSTQIGADSFPWL